MEEAQIIKVENGVKIVLSDVFKSLYKFSDRSLDD